MQKRHLLYVLLVVLAGQVIWLFDGLEFSEKLGLEGVVLAIAAVVLAIQHSNELNTVVNELRGIAQSVPTRGIGVFPSYMSEVAALVDRAQESVTVLCDTPAHGAFSYTAAFEEYWDNLRNKMLDNIRIECTYFDAPGREQLHRAQIAADEGNWKGWQDRNRKNSEAFDRLARFYGLKPTTDGEQAIEAWADTPDAYVGSAMETKRLCSSSFPSVGSASGILQGFTPGSRS